MRTQKRAVLACLMAAGVVLAVSGCRRAETDFDPYTDFSAYTSFVWEASGAEESEIERDYPLLMQDLRDAVEVVLTARGLKRGGADDAGLVMRAHIELAAYSEPTADSDMPARKLGPLTVAPFSVTQADDTELSRELQEGTIMLTATDRASGMLVWQSWLRRVMDMDDVRHAEWAKSPDPEDVAYRHKLITRAVDKLLAGFPPKTTVKLSDEGRAP